MRHVLLALAMMIAFGLSSRAQTTQPNLGAKPPEGAVVLFDGTSTDAWVGKDGQPCPWQVVEGSLEAQPKTGDIFTKQKFGDCVVHLEFRTPVPADGDKGQHRGNSGLFFQKAYEIQILESFGLPPSKGDCAAIYSLKAPDQNVALPPMQWQSYDITYRAPRFAADGKVSERPRITLIWNGVKVHDNAEIASPTRNHKDPDPKDPGPLELQDHGFKLQFKNIWVVPAKGE